MEFPNCRSQKCCKSLREEIQDEEEAFDHLRHCHVKFFWSILMLEMENKINNKQSICISIWSRVRQSFKLLPSSTFWNTRINTSIDFDLCAIGCSGREIQTIEVFLRKIPLQKKWDKYDAHFTQIWCKFDTCFLIFKKLPIFKCWPIFKMYHFHF